MKKKVYRKVGCVTHSRINPCAALMNNRAAGKLNKTIDGNNSANSN